MAATRRTETLNGVQLYFELQGSGEESTFSESHLSSLLSLGKTGIRNLLEAQERVLSQA